jgi:hypothetical protein
MTLAAIQFDQSCPSSFVIAALLIRAFPNPLESR